jgi:ribonuclease Z
MKLDSIFLTAIERDTVYGLPGLLSTMNFLQDGSVSPSDITIYAPESSGTRGFLNRILSLTSTDPNTEYISDNETILETNECNVTTFRTNRKGRGRSLGYRIEEPERKGRFDREKAEELGVPEGPKFGNLHEGNSVELDDGRTISPEQVVGPPRSGRALVYTGATTYPNEIPDPVRNADVFLCDGGMTSDFREKDIEGHMTAYQAGTVAGAANASLIVLTHIRPYYTKTRKPLIDELTDAYSGPYLTAEDGLKAQLCAQEEEGEATQLQDILSDLKGHSLATKFAD